MTFRPAIVVETCGASAERHLTASPRTVSRGGLSRACGCLVCGNARVLFASAYARTWYSYACSMVGIDARSRGPSRDVRGARGRGRATSCDVVKVDRAFVVDTPRITQRKRPPSAVDFSWAAESRVSRAV